MPLPPTVVPWLGPERHSVWQHLATAWAAVRTKPKSLQQVAFAVRLWPPKPTYQKLHVRSVGGGSSPGAQGGAQPTQDVTFRLRTRCTARGARELFTGACHF